MHPKIVLVPSVQVEIVVVSSELTESFAKAFKEKGTATVQDVSIRHSIVTVSPVCSLVLVPSSVEDDFTGLVNLSALRSVSQVVDDSIIAFYVVFEG